MEKSHSKFIIFTPILLLFILLSVTNLLQAQNLTGYVLDQHHQPIPGTQVFIPALNMGTVTSPNGYFELKNIPGGVYAVQFTYVGYRRQVLQIDTKKVNGPLHVTLQESTLQLPGVTVTGTAQPTDILSSSQSISAINNKQFQQLSGATAMSALRNTPGLSLITTGNGIAKPVIHGLSAQRIVVMVDGVRQDAQNWGGDHGPEISPFQVNRIEVVKGPSSVLYGAGALGGVVNVIGPDLPVSGNGMSILSGKLYLQGFSNNSQGAGSIALYGASGSVGYRVQISHITAGDITNPDGKVFNSGMHKTNGSFMVGTTQPWGTFSLDYDHLDQSLQIHDNATATGYQPLKNDLLHLHANIPTKDFRLEVQAGYQLNNRQEFDSKSAPNPGLFLKLNTGTVSIMAHHKPVGPVFGTIGVSSMIQSNRTLGTDKLIPGYNLQNFAAFIYEQARFGPLNLSAGGRFDTRNLDVLDTPALGIKATNRKYNALSGSFGAALHLTSSLSWSANIGHAWRAPTAFEMFADGVHEGTYQFDIGDSHLKPEAATNIQTSLKFVTNHIIGEVSVYNNHINKYIYADPTNSFDPQSGYRIYYLKQANARLRGMDASLQLEITNWVSVDGGYSLVRGKDLKLDQPLSFMPADHGDLGLKLQEKKIGKLSQPYLSIHAGFYSKMDSLQVAPNEPPSHAYALVDISLGSDLHLGNTPIHWDFIVQNLFNKAYVDHLSRYRDIPVLNPGRNIALKIQIPFGLIK